MERGCSTVVCIFIFTTIHLWAIHANNDEAAALLAFKKAVNDPDNELQSWAQNSVSPCSTWFHVTCEGDKVHEIDLPNKNLSGPLVSDIQDLTELQILELFNNQINGSIPKEFGNLTNLVTLDLYGNNLTGSIPEELGKLKNLKRFRLNNNKFQGPLPKAILDLIPQLDVFNISGNPAMCGNYTENPFCLD